MKKKIFTLILSCVLCFSGIPAMPTSTVTATENIDNSYEQVADLTISSVRELNEFAQKVNAGNSYAGKVVKLTANIQFDGVTVNNFTPIGNNYDVEGKYYVYKQFQGTFDGNGYVISGIDVTNIDNDYVGLFGRIGEGGVVKNVIIKDSQFDGGGSGTGAIAARNYGMIENCHNRNTKVKSSVYVGGIVSYNGGTILNCSSTGKIEGNSAGGIAGTNAGTIYNACNLGEIVASSAAGGIACDNDSGSTIQNCYNIGKIQSSSENTGGIVAYANGIIANSFCSQESASVNFGTMGGVEKNCKAFPESLMRTASFVSQLNTNRGNNASQWLEWEIRSQESVYPLQVKKLDLSQCQIIPSNTPMVYDGTEKNLGILIKQNGKMLTEGVDYSLEYLNNLSAGTAAVVIEGMGRYMGREVKLYEIAPIHLSGASVTLSSINYAYDGYSKMPDVSVIYKENELEEDVDYSVVYQNNVKEGTATAIITGKGNFTGTVYRNFTIQKRNQELAYTKSYKKIHGESAFFLGVNHKQGDGTLSYTSSNKNVATVNKVGRVKLKEAGTTTITVTAAETKKYRKKIVMITIKVLPKTQVAKVTAGRKKLKVSWKADKKVTGYEIQYTTKRTFRGAKTITVNSNKKKTRTISKLKSNKRYRVRLRSYKMVNVNNKVEKWYGNYSNVVETMVK